MHAIPPEEIVIDLDATDAPVHGEQEGLAAIGRVLGLSTGGHSDWLQRGAFGEGAAGRRALARDPADLAREREDVRLPADPGGVAGRRRADKQQAGGAPVAGDGGAFGGWGRWLRSRVLRNRSRTVTV